MALSAIRTSGRRLAKTTDDYLKRAGRGINEQVGRRSVQVAGIGGASLVGYKGLGAYETHQESEATQSYMDARQAILNDPNLSPAEKQRRLDALRDDYRGNSGGPGDWFKNISMTQAIMFIGMGWVAVKLIPQLVGVMG